MAHLKSEKFQLVMEKSMIAAVDDWSFANRVRTRAEAMRRLISVGLESGQSLTATDNMTETQKGEVTA